MNYNNQDRYGLVILSEAKNLCGLPKILRFAQNDKTDFDWESSLSRPPWRILNRGVDAINRVPTNTYQVAIEAISLSKR